MLPHVMDFNMGQREEKYTEVAKILEPGGQLSGTGAIDAVLKLREDIGIDRSITDLGASDETLDLLVADALADPVNFSNPRPVDEDSVRALYQAAW